MEYEQSTENNAPGNRIKSGEEKLDIIADLEEYASRGEPPPLCRGYRIKINGRPYVVENPVITGAEVLNLAGLTPPESYTLRVKKAGQRPKKVALDEEVNLRSSGIEKFKALPKDQTEGLDIRRQFQLPANDIKFLNDYGLAWETINDGSQWVLIHDFPTPQGYNEDKVTAAIRIETGYPITQLDMVYFSPTLSRLDGKPIGATQCSQQIDNKPYQRWSRHRTPQNPWIPGQDNLGSHIILIEKWLER